MTITRTQEQDTVTLALSGRLDSLTFPVLSSEIDTLYGGAPIDLVLDFSQIDYVSSAGLRVVVGAQKKATAAAKKLTLRALQPAVRDVFVMTGLSSVLTIAD